MKNNNKKQQKISQKHTMLWDRFDSCIRMELLNRSINAVPYIDKETTEDEEIISASFDMDGFSPLIKYHLIDGSGIIELKIKFPGYESEFDLTDVLTLADIFDSEIYIYIDSDEVEGVTKNVALIFDAIETNKEILKQISQSGNIVSIDSQGISEDSDFKIRDALRMSKVKSEYKKRPSARNREKYLSVLEEFEQRGILDVSEKAILRKLRSGEDIHFEKDADDRDKLFIGYRTKLTLIFTGAFSLFCLILHVLLLCVQMKVGVVDFSGANIAAVATAIFFATFAFNRSIANLIAKKKFTKDNVKVSKKATLDEGKSFNIRLTKIIFPIVFGIIAVVSLVQSTQVIAIGEKGITYFIGPVGTEYSFSELDTYRVLGTQYDEETYELYDYPVYIFTSNDGYNYRFDTLEEEDALAIEDIFKKNGVKVTELKTDEGLYPEDEDILSELFSR